MSVRSMLEYACQVWSPHSAHYVSSLQNVQYHAARWEATGGIILLRGGINPPIIVLMCYIGLR